MKSAYKMLGALSELTESGDCSDEVKEAAASLEKALKSDAGIQGEDKRSDEASSDDGPSFGKAGDKAREKFRSSKKEDPESSDDEDAEKK